LPVLFVMNHPSWWDPMVGAALIDLLPEYSHYVAMDATTLKVYWVFRRLGFFGINMNTLAGARTFLRTGSAILADDCRALWVTAQGEFADVRKRPLALKPGVGHLAARLDRGWIVPIAVEYVFWNERKPEALVRIGEPISLESGHQPVFANTSNSETRAKARTPAKAWIERIEAVLTETLDALNAEAISRDASLFTPLIGK